MRDAVQLANALVATVLAPVCAGCACVLEQPLYGPVCPSCWAAIPRLNPPLCARCGAMLPSWRAFEGAGAQCAACRTQRHSALSTGRAAGSYEGSLREIVHAFKYDGRRTLAAPLGALLRDAGRELLEGASCAVPVPLHRWRRIHRGFNQAADLAAALPIPVLHALRRQHMTAPQTGLTAAARRRNVRGVFRLSRFATRRMVHSMLVDRVVILVDDVRTTGATLDACAHVLKDAGAKEVRALTVALADPHVHDAQ